MKTSKPLQAALIILSAAILLSTVAVLTVYGEKTSASVNERIGACNALAKEYVEEYQTVNAETQRVKAERDRYASFGKSMSMLLFQQCSDNLYDTVYLKAMKQYGAAGVFTIRSDQNVGMEGCITPAQYRTLLKNGWMPALGLPETLPSDFDIQAYFSEIEGYLAELSARLILEYEESLSSGDAQPYDDPEKELTIEFPRVFVFGRENYARELYEAVCGKGFETVFYPAEDPSCDLEDMLLESKDALLLVPYYYTSKRTPIRKTFEKDMRNGRNITVSTGGARSGMVGETATHDTTLASLKDIIETLKVRNRYFRSYASYRADRLKADTEYRMITASLDEQAKKLRAESIYLHRLILNIYTEKDAASFVKRN